MVTLKSTGGSGTQFFKNRYSNVNPTENPHQRREFASNEIMVYIYANPVDILSSFARRGYLHMAIGSLGLIPGGDVPADLSVDHIIALGRDLYDFEGHYNYFRGQKCRRAIVRYEGLSKNLKQIETFTNLMPNSSVLVTPRVKHLTEKQINGIADVYKGWVGRYNQLPEIELIEA